MILSLFASPFARSVAGLFRDHPEEWRAGGRYYNSLSEGRFHVYNTARDIQVWIANGSFAVSVDHGGVEVYGVTAWCLVGGSPDQQAIWRGYRDWRNNIVRAAITKALPTNTTEEA